MAIQMRRGPKAKFNPTKLLPGEWAVSIDGDTDNQVVWMCFAPGVVKRMGTYEDFESMINEIMEDIRSEYKKEFDSILAQVKAYAEDTEKNTDTVLTIRDDIVNTYLPQITQNAKEAEKNAALSQSYAVGGTGTRTGEDEDNAEYYCSKAAEYNANIEKRLRLATFGVNDDGELIYTDNTGNNFSVNDDGDLIWEVA